jgi:hypothetical protein
MTPEERDRMYELCKLIQDEKDPQKFSDLTDELNQLLDKKRERVESTWKQ